jgi:uncharacterized protein (TIGR03546 family)
MMSFVLRPLRIIIQSLVAHDAPQQLAAGFALGMVVGLLPKGNLIAISLFVTLFSLRVNTGISLVAIVLFTWLSPLFDPFADKLGLAVLSADSCQAVYASVYSWPLGPWLEFNNTAVMGSFLLGVYFFYPVYWFANVVFTRLQPRAAEQPLNTPRPFERRAA